MVLPLGHAGRGGCSFGVGDSIEACPPRRGRPTPRTTSSATSRSAATGAASRGARGPARTGLSAQRKGGARPAAGRGCASPAPDLHIKARRRRGEALRVRPARCSFRLNASDGSVAVAQRQRRPAARLCTVPGRCIWRTSISDACHSSRDLSQARIVHVYPQWSPGSSRGRAAHGQLDESRTRSGGAHEPPLPDRRPAPDLCCVHGRTRARPPRAVQSQRAEYFGPESSDAAAAAGACHERGCEGRCEERLRTSVAYATSRRGGASAQCEVAAGRGSWSRAPGEGHRSHRRRARRCDAPHWFVNFDRASIVADLAEKCSPQQQEGCQSRDRRAPATSHGAAACRPRSASTPHLRVLCSAQDPRRLTRFARVLRAVPRPRTRAARVLMRISPRAPSWSPASQGRASGLLTSYGSRRVPAEPYCDGPRKMGVSISAPRAKRLRVPQVPRSASSTTA